MNVIYIEFDSYNLLDMAVLFLRLKITNKK